MTSTVGKNSGRAPHDRGVTLIELLVVIAIIAMLMGIGAMGFYALRRSMQREGVISDVESILRLARNTALSTHTMSQVRIDAKSHTLRAVGYRLAGQWHFEDPKMSGAFGIDADAVGGSLFPTGKIGQCVSFPYDSPGYVDLGGEYDFRDGGYVEAYLYPTVPDVGTAGGVRSGEQVLFEKGKYLRLIRDRDGVLHARVAGVKCSTVPEEPERAAPPPKPALRSRRRRSKPPAAPKSAAPPSQVLSVGHGLYRLPTWRWSKVALQWVTFPGEDDKPQTEVTILVNDIVRARGEGPGEIKSLRPFTIGSRNSPYFGRVDEARLLVAVHSDVVRLPPQMPVAHIRPQRVDVFFDSQGHLDARHHPGPQRFEIILDNKLRVAMRVDMLGKVADVVKSKYNPADDAANSSPAPAGNSSASQPRRRRRTN